jgi:DNA invertase Pin-like site-specific DNA recombinase
MMQSEKIQASHRARGACVYVRQSDPYQVKHNLESQRLQYELEEKARQLGFAEVRVIDEDLGRSGTETDKRHGFQNLVLQVSSHALGMILVREASRLARNNADWYHLLDLCGLFDTLIADQDGVYHPALPNDRMVLGLKGMMSEMELGLLKGRLLEGARNKAKRGELVYRLPVGLVRGPGGGIEKDPHAGVQAALEQVFSKFRETQSIRRTLLWFLREGIAFPHLDYSSSSPTLVWKAPAYSLFNSILKNPFYAGAYVYGRRTTRTEFKDSRVRKTGGHALPMAQWKVLIKDHHSGYLSWEEFERNQQTIAHNLRRHGQASRGPVLGGEALLAGLLRCRRCGRKLEVRYGGKQGSGPAYACRGERHQKEGNYCLHFGGLRVEEAVSREILRVVQPAALEAASRALEEINQEAQEQLRLLTLDLEQAEYEAERAFRQYNRVEPENRLVAANLEANWNSKLQQVEAIKQRLAEVQKGIHPLSDQEKASLLSLAEDLPSVWNAESSTPEMRKRIARTLLAEAIVDLDPEQRKVVLELHWRGGTHTRLEVKRNRAGQHRYCTDQEVVDLVRQLAAILPDGGMAPILNRLGYQTGRGNTWTAKRIRSVRQSYAIPAFNPQADRPFLTLEQTAEKLKISQQSVRGLIEKGVITANQVVPFAPWCVKIEDLQREEVKQAAAAIAQRRPWRWRSPSRRDQPDLFPENRAL